jgi:hypothetical protein
MNTVYSLDHMQRMFLGLCLLVLSFWPTTGGYAFSPKANTISKKIEIQSGDIIFQTSGSSQSKAIQLATKSRYSHMGIIYEIEGEFYVYEAVQPVKLTKLNDWIQRGEGSHYVIKRLKDSKDKLTT